MVRSSLGVLYAAALLTGLVLGGLALNGRPRHRPLPPPPRPLIPPRRPYAPEGATIH